MTTDASRGDRSSPTEEWGDEAKSPGPATEGGGSRGGGAARGETGGALRYSVSVEGMDAILGALYEKLDRDDGGGGEVGGGGREGDKASPFWIPQHAKPTLRASDGRGADGGRGDAGRRRRATDAPEPSRTARPSRGTPRGGRRSRRRRAGADEEADAELRLVLGEAGGEEHFRSSVVPDFFASEPSLGSNGGGRGGRRSRRKKEQRTKRSDRRGSGTSGASLSGVSLSDDESWRRSEGSGEREERLARPNKLLHSRQGEGGGERDRGEEDDNEEKKDEKEKPPDEPSRRRRRPGGPRRRATVDGGADGSAGLQADPTKRRYFPVEGRGARRSGATESDAAPESRRRASDAGSTPPPRPRGAGRTRRRATVDSSLHVAAGLRGCLRRGSGFSARSGNGAGGSNGGGGNRNVGDDPGSRSGPHQRVSWSSTHSMAYIRGSESPDATATLGSLGDSPSDDGGLPLGFPSLPFRPGSASGGDDDGGHGGGRARAASDGDEGPSRAELRTVSERGVAGESRDSGDFFWPARGRVLSVPTKTEDGPRGSEPSSGSSSLGADVGAPSGADCADLGRDEDDDGAPTRVASVPTKTDDGPRGMPASVSSSPGADVVAPSSDNGSTDRGDGDFGGEGNGAPAGTEDGRWGAPSSAFSPPGVSAIAFRSSHGGNVHGNGNYSHENQGGDDRRKDDEVEANDAPHSPAPTVKPVSATSLPGYHLGATAKHPFHVIVPPDAATAVKLASSLKPLDFAFVLRSSGEWTYSIVADLPDGTEGPCIRFVMDEGGSTKTIRKKYWGRGVRIANRRAFDEDDGEDEEPEAERRAPGRIAPKESQTSKPSIESDEAVADEASATMAQARNRRGEAQSKKMTRKMNRRQSREGVSKSFVSATTARTDMAAGGSADEYSHRKPQRPSQPRMTRAANDLRNGDLRTQPSADRLGTHGSREVDQGEKPQCDLPDGLAYRPKKSPPKKSHREAYVSEFNESNLTIGARDDGATFRRISSGSGGALSAAQGGLGRQGSKDGGRRRFAQRRSSVGSKDSVSSLGAVLKEMYSNPEISLARAERA